MTRPRQRAAETDLQVADPSQTGWPDWADPAAVQRLQEIVRSGHPGHAYLLSGPRGVGKAALARAFAQGLCCSFPDSHDPALPCGVCRICRNIGRGTYADVEEFNLETQAALAEKPGSGATLTIDTVRRLRSNAALLPLECTRRLLLVDDAETLLEPAQQALLKTLEEPPPSVTIVLMADEPEALLATVRSRCREVTVRPLGEAAIERSLVSRGVEPILANEAASLSRGRPAWARAAVVDRRLLEARRRERDAAREWVHATEYERLVTAFRLGEQVTKRRQDVIGTIQAAIQLLRAEMLLNAGAAAAEDGTAAAPPVNQPLAAAMGRAIAASVQCLSDLDANVRPRLALETMVLAWPNQDSQSL